MVAHRVSANGMGSPGQRKGHEADEGCCHEDWVEAEKQRGVVVCCRNLCKRKRRTRLLRHFVLTPVASTPSSFNLQGRSR